MGIVAVKIVFTPWTLTVGSDIGSLCILVAIFVFA